MDTYKDKINLQTLYFVTTNSCNLSCKYCYESQTKFRAKLTDKLQVLMDEKVAKEAIKFFIDSNTFNIGKKLYVNFFGGEPTLNLGIIKYVCNEFANISKNRQFEIEYGIVTNGTMLTKETLEFFSKYNFTITVSIDGPPNVNDVQRPFTNDIPSTPSLFNSISKLVDFKKKGKLKKIAAEATITTHTLKQMKIEDVFSYLLGLGFDYIHLVPAHSKTSNDYSLQEIEFWKAFGEFSKKIFDSWLTDNPLPSTDAYKIMRGVIKGNVSICPAGEKLFSIAPDGGIYACQALTGVQEFKIGDVFSSKKEDFENMMEKLTKKNKKSNSICSSCRIVDMCPKYCFASNYFRQGSIDSFSGNDCPTIINMVEYLIKYTRENVKVQKNKDKLIETIHSVFS
ncbi:MAG: radical SAM protein [Cuniculiplasma sp.]